MTSVRVGDPPFIHYTFPVKNDDNRPLIIRAIAAVAVAYLLVGAQPITSFESLIEQALNDQSAVLNSKGGVD